MRKGFTIIELLIVVVFITILVVLGLSCKNGGGLSTGYGRNLKLESVEGSIPKKWHWTDTETGERFYSFDQDANPLYKE